MNPNIAGTTTQHHHDMTLMQKKEKKNTDKVENENEIQNLTLFQKGLSRIHNFFLHFRSGSILFTSGTTFLKVKIYTSFTKFK